MPLRGVMNGPVHVRGIAPDLGVEGDLTGPAGHLTYNGKVDADSLGGYGARGSGAFDALHAAMLFGKSEPPSRLAGSYEVDLNGDSLANLFGSLAVRLGNSDADGMRLAKGTARMRFDRGVLLVDTARVEGDAGVMRAQGTLGLTRASANDSLQLSVDVDSLGGLRRYLGRAKDSSGKKITLDSLSGSLAFRGLVRGWLDSLDVHGQLTGQSLYVRGDRARSVTGTLSVSDVLGRVTGALDLRADAAMVAGVRIDSAVFAANILDAGHAHFTTGARGENKQKVKKLARGTSKR
jgi:autotransporter translocation and assembly factor TamB